MKKITRTQIEAELVPLPPKDEQGKTTAQLEKQVGTVARARAAAERELEAINALPAALLRRAFRGGL